MKTHPRRYYSEKTNRERACLWSVENFGKEYFGLKKWCFQQNQADRQDQRWECLRSKMALEWSKVNKHVFLVCLEMLWIMHFLAYNFIDESQTTYHISNIACPSKFYNSSFYNKCLCSHLGISVWQEGNITIEPQDVEVFSLDFPLAYLTDLSHPGRRGLISWMIKSINLMKIFWKIIKDSFTCGKCFPSPTKEIIFISFC